MDTNNTTIDINVQVTILGYLATVQILTLSPLVLLLNIILGFLVISTKFVDQSLKLMLLLSIIIDLLLTAGLITQGVHFQLFALYASFGDMGSIGALDTVLTCNTYLNIIDNPEFSGLFLLIAISVERTIESRTDRQGKLTWKYLILSTLVLTPFVMHLIRIIGESEEEIFSEHFCNHYIHTPLKITLAWLSFYAVTLTGATLFIFQTWKRLLKTKITYISTNKLVMTVEQRFRLEQNTNCLKMLQPQFVSHIVVLTTGLVMNATGAIVIHGSTRSVIEGPTTREVGLIMQLPYIYGLIVRPAFIIWMHPKLRDRIWKGLRKHKIDTVSTISTGIQQLEILKNTWQCELKNNR